jgi:hypothetical protein
MAKRTIRRRMRKNRTIRKVMRGCNRRRMKKGGAPPPGLMEVHQYAGASPSTNASLATMQQHAGQSYSDAKAQSSVPAIPLPLKSGMTGGISTTPAAPAKGMQGGARTRHHRRRLRYKKSMARKSRCA